jgi:uncharacterized LabA/DUF88 family protein
MPIVKHPSQRVAVFIDTQNLYHSAKHLHGARVNFGNVLEDAVMGRQLVRAIAYVISTESGEENPFFEALQNMGIETKIKDLQVFSGGAKKADWDVGLAIDAVRHSSKVDAIIIVSGDGDFVPLVEYLKNTHGVQVEVVSFGASSSGKLKESADEFFDLSLDPSRYVMGKETTRRPRTRRP